MFKSPQVYKKMSPVPRKTQNRERKHPNGDNGNRPVQDSEYPPKYNNRGKTQKNSGRKFKRMLASSIKSDLITRNDNQKLNRFDLFTLDSINLKIIVELITNGDVKSSEIAAKLKVPLSTIQRRRTRIEKSLLKKSYKMDLKFLGNRTALVFIDVQGGKAKEIGEELLRKYDKNVVNASTRINSSNNLCLKVIYYGSEELHYLLEEIKAISSITKVDWSEEVMLIGDNISEIIKNTLAYKLETIQAPKILV
jgi:DNA-binding Lrp family transcriptional regulator